MGWTLVDPVASRVVAAALFAIGIESLLVQKKELAVFRAMLSLKIIWSFATVLGFLFSIIQGGGSWGAWFFLGIFVVFNGLWVYYKWRLG